jgi:DNA polymerase III alpha subunit
LELTKITKKGILEKKLQDLTPSELHEITVQTYTKFKKEIIHKYSDPPQENQTSNFSIANYIERLEYELKVIKEMGFN